VLQVEQCGLTLAHQFPWAASSYVAVGLALRRRLLAPDTPSTAAKRKQISKVRGRTSCWLHACGRTSLMCRHIWGFARGRVGQRHLLIQRVPCLTDFCAMPFAYDEKVKASMSCVAIAICKLSTCGIVSRPTHLHSWQCLQTGVSRGADSAAGWLGLAELQYQERQYERSYQTGVDG
jgi:hypothetical protein